MDFVVPADHWVKIQAIENIDKYFDLAWELKKITQGQKGDGNTNSNWNAWNGPKKLEKL